MYDKQGEGKPFRTAVKNVAAEHGFYNLATDDGITTLEPSLGRLEDSTARILNRIRTLESIATLSDEDRMILSVFGVVQMHRTNSFRLKLADMTNQFSERMREFAPGFGIPDHQAEDRMPGVRRLTRTEVKSMSIDMTADAAKLGPLVFEKSLVLCKAQSGKCFLLSDNPVALHNMQDHGWRGSIGLAVEGIEIYLPISSRLLLWWVCPSYEVMFRDNLARAKAMLPFALGDLRARLTNLKAQNQQFLDAIDDGKPLAFSSDNMDHANSMQGFYAERFLFGAGSDFSLIHSMIESDPKVRRGPRGVVQ